MNALEMYAALNSHELLHLIIFISIHNNRPVLFFINEYLLMTDKVLQEFSTRIVRAKALLDSTKSQCTLLKKEAIKLEKVSSLSQNFCYNDN